MILNCGTIDYSLVDSPRPRLFGLPDGSVTKDRQYAREQWEIWQLMRNVISTHAAKAAKCYKQGVQDDD